VEGASAVAAATGLNAEDARQAITDHIRVCVDCCHLSVEYEDPIDALDELASAGIGVGRIQLSSALTVPAPANAAEAARLAGRLEPFADATYLHQVIERCDGTLRHFSDLDTALAVPGAPAHEWRIHFHVPLFAAEYGELGSTQADVRTLLGALAGRSVTTHLEIETYTWDVLPAGLKLDLADSIAREYEWVLACLGESKTPDAPGDS
jgi:hypothetical protein